MSLLVVAVLIVVAASTFYRFVNTLRRLEVVEAERDRWQRPAEIMQALSLGEGGIVADVGCGAGYLALKLSRLVGARGRVFAVDIRLMPLLFLRTRALLRNQRNVVIVRGDPDDPRLPTGALDAVLLLNMYHELADPKSILDHAFRALRTGGRLVVVDPSPDAVHGREEHQHQEPGVAEARLRQTGFKIVSREDRFVDRSGTGAWWLIVARKP